MLTTQETRELGASVIAYVSPPKDETAVLAKKKPAKNAPTKKASAKRS